LILKTDKHGTSHALNDAGNNHTTTNKIMKLQNWENSNTEIGEK
jgi:hypothetical protein